MARKRIAAVGDGGYFMLVPHNQEHSNLVVLRNTRRLTQKEKIEARRDAGKQPPNIEIDPKYARLMCRECSAINPNDIFDAGFDGDRTIRMKGDFGYSDDSFFLMNGRMVEALQREMVTGFETAPVGKDWFAVKITAIVTTSPGVWKSRGRKCRTCGRPEEMIGGYDRLSQIGLPGGERTLFTPSGVHITGRQWFRVDVHTPMVSGDVVPILLQNRIKGGACRKLLSDQEWQTYIREARKSAVFLARPGVITLR